MKNSNMLIESSFLLLTKSIASAQQSGFVLPSRNILALVALIYSPNQLGSQAPAHSGDRSGLGNDHSRAFPPFSICPRWFKEPVSLVSL